MPEPAIRARILHGDQVWQPRYPLGTAAGKRSIDPSATPKNNLSLDYVVFVRILVSVEEPTNDHARAAVAGN